MKIKVKNGSVQWNIPGMYQGTFKSGRVTIQLMAQSGTIEHPSLQSDISWRLDIHSGKNKGKVYKSNTLYICFFSSIILSSNRAITTNCNR